VLETGTIVAAKMRRVHHFDRQLALDRQREKAPSKLTNLIELSAVNPVANQIKEADVARSFAQITQERRAFGGTRIGAPQIKSRYFANLLAGRHDASRTEETHWFSNESSDHAVSVKSINQSSDSIE
jgi:hypothetical protein